MMSVKAEYPCGMKYEVKAISFFSSLSAIIRTGDDADEDVLLCPLHGKKCQMLNKKAR